MAKENTPATEAPANAASEAPKEAPKTVPIEQYDELVRQFQSVVNEANSRLSALEKENTLLKDTLATQNRLVDKLFKAEETK